MNTKTTISMSEARRRLFEVAENVQSPHTVFTFTEKGKPKVVMMSAENFESWAETLEVMSLFPDLRTENRQLQKAVADKSYFTWDTFDAVFGKKHTKTVVHTRKEKKTPRTR